MRILLDCKGGTLVVRFPDYVDSRAWAAQFNPLDARECEDVARHVRAILRAKYAMAVE